MKPTEEYAETMFQKELDHCRKRDPARLERLQQEEPEKIEAFRKGLLSDAEDMVDRWKPIQGIVERSGEVAIFDDWRRGRFHPSNKASRKLFEATFDVKLPATVSGTRQVLSQLCPLDRLEAELLKEQEEEASRVRLEQEAEERRAAVQRFDTLEPLIATDKMISGEDLLFACRFLDVEVHPRTAGLLKRHVVEVNSSRSRVHKGRKGGGAYSLYAACQEAIRVKW